MEESISLEEAISENIVKYMHRDDFINRDIASLDRIVSKYFNQNDKNQSEEKEVVEFLFQCLNIKGKDASVLFTHVNNSSYRNYIIRRLYREYRETFDFDLVNSSLFLRSFEIINTNLILLIISIILAFSFILVSTVFFFYHKHSNKQIFDINTRINKLLKDQEKYENETISVKEKYKKNLQFTENLKLRIENLTNKLNEKEPKVTKRKENDELEFNLKKCVDENQYYNLTNDLFKFITKSITKNLSIHGSKLCQYFNNSVLTISNTNTFDDPDIRVEIVVDDIIKMYFQKSFVYCDNLISDFIENHINNKNANELIKLSREDFIKPIEYNICEIFISKLNEFFRNVSNVFPQKLERYSFNLRSKIQKSLNEAFKNRYKKIVMLNNKDSNDAEKVQNFIKLVRLPHQKYISIFAFGRNRTFNLDENGNVITPIQYTYIEKFKYKQNEVTLDKQKHEFPINVTFDFAKMAIHTNITKIRSRITQNIYHYFLFFGKIVDTYLRKQIITIEIGGDFIFKDTMKQKYYLESPLDKDNYSCEVPDMIPITMR